MSKTQSNLNKTCITEIFWKSDIEYRQRGALWSLRRTTILQAFTTKIGHCDSDSMNEKRQIIEVSKCPLWCLHAHIKRGGLKKLYQMISLLQLISNSRNSTELSTLQRSHRIQGRSSPWLKVLCLPARALAKALSTSASSPTASPIAVVSRQRESS